MIIFHYIKYKLISDSEDGLKQIKTLLKYLSKVSRHISNTITSVKQLLKVSIECDLESEQKETFKEHVSVETATKFNVKPDQNVFFNTDLNCEYDKLSKIRFEELQKCSLDDKT